MNTYVIINSSLSAINFLIQIHPLSVYNATYCSQATDHLVAKQLLQELQCDNQLSVRYMMEWVVVLTLGRQPELLDAVFYPYLHHVSHVRVQDNSWPLANF